MSSPVSPPRPISITFIVIAAFAAATGLWVGQKFLSAPSMPSLKNAVLYPTPRPIPDFMLTQANGKPLTLADWRGRWNVVYIGYATCPDVCPTTLATFKTAWRDLQNQKQADDVRFDFVSVDPQRDTPELLTRYVSFFSPDFIAATGSDEQLTPFTRNLGLIYSRSTDANGNIEVDHSGSPVIVDPQGRLLGMFRPPFTAADVAADLVALKAGGR